MPLPVAAAGIAAAAAAALSDPYIRGAVIGTVAHGGDKAVQYGINKGLRSKRKPIRKIANTAADLYEAVDSSELGGIWKNALTGAASDMIGRKSQKFIRQHQFQQNQQQHQKSAATVAAALKPKKKMMKKKRPMKKEQTASKIMMMKRPHPGEGDSDYA